MRRMIFSVAVLFCLEVGADFTPPVDLAGLLTSQPSPAQVSINASGTAMSVWDEFDGTNYSLISSLYQNGSWAPITVISPSTDPINSLSNVSLNSTNKALIAYEKNDSSVWAVFFDGTTWGSPATISGSSLFSGSLTVGYNDSNQAIVVWGAQDGHIYANINNNGGGWQGSPIDVSQGGNSGSPCVALSNNHLAIVVWSLAGSTAQNYYATYNFQTNTWSDPAIISSSVNYQYTPQIAINSSGQAAATWIENNMGVNQTVASLYNGSWGSAATLSSPSSGDYVSYLPSQVAIDDSGSAYVVWTLNSSSIYRTQAAVYRSGSWTAPTNLSTDTNNNTNSPSIAAANGSAIAVWNQVYIENQHTNSHAVYASLYIDGSWLPNTETLALSSETEPDNANGGGYKTPPGVSLNSSGQAVVSWFLFDGTNYFVQAATDYITNSISPPAAIQGQQKTNIFPFQKQYYNSLQWSPSPSSQTISYGIFRNGVMLATVAGLQYTDNAISWNQTYTYSVVAIDASGNQSAPINVTVSH